MRPRTFILLILVLLVLAAAVVLFVVIQGDGDLASLLPGGGRDDVPAEATPAPGDGVAAPAPTPTRTNFVPVVTAKIALPAGQRITEDVLQIEMRPNDNIAVQAGYVFDNAEDLVGRIARTDIAAGQELLASMVALSPTDLAAMGSDLALYVDQGNVAVAFPIDRYSGAAFAMRPGDAMDVLMTLSLVKVDEEFQSALPNVKWRVDEQQLADGNSFLFSPVAEGRLELIPGINLVASVGPAGQGSYGPGSGNLLQIPRRVTQLTIQQATVLWVGTWRDPAQLEQQRQAAAARAAAAGLPAPTPSPLFERRETNPDIVILSMPVQDALALKWAMDRGLNIDLALRAQGDDSVFITTSVTLPQLVEQGGLTIPERGDLDVDPRADEVEPPSLPANPPGN